MNGIIYCFTFPNSKRYVGKTEKELQVRLNYHKHCSKYIKNHLYNAIRKYGWNNLKIEVLCECNSKEELNEKEKYFILQFGSTDPEKGYNLRSGGEGGLHSKSTKLKISESNKGIKNGMYNKIPWNKNKKLTKQHVENLRNSHLGQEPWNKGKKLPKRGELSNDVKNKISKANSGDNNGMAKLTCEIVKEIREKYQTGDYTQKELSMLYCISKACMSEIINYKAWKNCN